jgi:hypothetical protein
MNVTLAARKDNYHQPILTLVVISQFTGEIHRKINSNKNMKTQIDIKSVLLGIVVGVLTVFAIGAGTSISEVGRYQISASNDFIVMVDTKTGEAWGKAATTDGEGGKDGKFWGAK